MQRRIIRNLGLIATSLFFSSCTHSETNTPIHLNTETNLRTSQSVIPLELDFDHIGRSTIVVMNPEIRTLFSQSGHDFTVKFKNGIADIPLKVAANGVYGIEMDRDLLVYGDIAGDQRPEVIVPIKEKTAQGTLLEIAAFTSSGGNPLHFSSFPIGKADLKSMSITNRKIRINFVHQVPGDPGPRNSEFILELPASHQTQ